MKAFTRLFMLSAIFGLSACGTLADMKATLMGDDDSARAPASVNPDGTKSIAVQSGAKSADLQTGAGPTGPDLASNEFAREQRLNDEGAQRGIRRNADPWMGVGPSNEGSLWIPDTQDNFFFSRNTRNKVGDFVTVKLENEVVDSLNTKIASQISRSSVQDVVADEAGKEVEGQVAKKVGQAVGNANIGKAVGAAAGERAVAAIDPGHRYIDIQEVNARILKSLPNNQFLVEGERKIFIQGATYALKLTGTVRDEDLGTAKTVASNQLFDSKLELTK